MAAGSDTNNYRNEKRSNNDSPEKPTINKHRELVARTVLTQARHFEKIEACQIEAQLWLALPKERMKTVSVVLVLCLNIPVDPPDIVKPRPCARLESWIDPMSMSPTRAIKEIANSLQTAYGKWQPRARYKQSLDPTIEDIKKICSSLRRNAKEERVLFHYNGHGVPKPTANGEIWVFNSNYTQYLPLSIYELQSWMGTPSIYVYDCSNAGIIVKCESFNEVPQEHDKNQMHNNGDTNMKNGQVPSSSSTDGMFSSNIRLPNLNSHTSHINQNIQLAACGSSEILPMHPDLPADVFTSCLTTPIQMAIRWHILQKKGKHLPGLTLEIVNKIPGQASDRRTVLGELNWIFTTITDTIAWNTLPRELFQRLFRQDLLVACLFRNFLLAERIMRAYNCTPVSCPALPNTHQHHMWDSWDLALELCLTNLLKNCNNVHKDTPPSTTMSPFFKEQLTAFQVWLNLGSVDRNPPEQLPILLQVLLSQVYRQQALDLLGSFLSLGPWAVNLVLNVGIFHYILRLLQSTARELKPLLIYLWAKILAVDPNCRNDLIGEQAFKYFIPVLVDQDMPAEDKTMAAFVLSVMVTDHPESQRQALQGSLQSQCLEQLNDSHPPLRQWLAICLGQSWHHNPDARWSATRNLAHEKLYNYLEDPVPEVRAAAVYALGTFISSLPLGESSDQARSINHTITITLANSVAEDGSPLVRRELVAAMQFLIILYESSYVMAAKQHCRETDIYSSLSSLNLGSDSVSSSTNSLTRTKTPSKGQHVQSPDKSLTEMPGHLSPLSLTKTTSLHSLNSLGNNSGFSGVSSLSYGGMYQRLWQILLMLERDPFPSVAELASVLVEKVLVKVRALSSRELSDSRVDLTPGTPTNRGSPPTPLSEGSTPVRLQPRMTQSESGTTLCFPKNIVKTEFVKWSSRAFIVPMKDRCPSVAKTKPPLLNTDRPVASRFMDEVTETKQINISKLEDQVFIRKNEVAPCVLQFHPEDPVLAVAGNDSVSIWDLENQSCMCTWSNKNVKSTIISSLAVINPRTSQTYIACGSTDGAIRVWRNVFNSSYTNTSTYVRESRQDPTPSPSLVTAFQAMKEVTPSTRVHHTGLMMSWEQQQQTLVVGGDSNIVRLWDLEQEKKIFDYQVDNAKIDKVDNVITALHSLDNLPEIVTGFADGYLRLLDRRVKRPIVNQWRDQTSYIISAQLLNINATFTKIIYGCSSGEVRLCDIRQSTTTQVCQIGQEITTMANHPSVQLFALGSMHQISVHEATGSLMNTIKYYDGFMGQKIAPVSRLAFHPTRVLLAAGTNDSYVSVYKLKG